MESSTKKCPYCAEEIQSEAIICKHCKSSLVNAEPNKKVTPPAEPASGMTILKLIGILMLVFIGIAFWYVSIPALVIWYLFKKQPNKYSKKTSIVISTIVTVVFLGLGAIQMYENRAPQLQSIEPADGATFEMKTVTIKGSVSPSNSKVLVNDNSATIDSEGVFSSEVQLPNDTNAISIKATNGSKETLQTITLMRTFTPEEQAERDRLKAEAEAARKAKAEEEKAAKEKAEAEAKAEQAKYEASKAGQLCKKNTSWTKEDCLRVADKKYWIGMSYDMLVASYGSKPDHANPSNYGSGVQWQWCWMSYKPSCFYDNNGDGLIDSYN